MLLLYKRAHLIFIFFGGSSCGVLMLFCFMVCSIDFLHSSYYASLFTFGVAVDVPFMFTIVVSSLCVSSCCCVLLLCFALSLSPLRYTLLCASCCYCVHVLPICSL